MPTIKQQETALFEEWRKRYPNFISDGIFDENEWDKQPVKILFVLKEANWEKGNADLCKWLLSEPACTYWKTWNNVVRWSKALITGGDYPIYVSNEDKSAWLRKIAFLNLKKVGGAAVAENKTIKEYVIRDSDLIRKQILLYRPDIIICCGRGTGKNADLLYEYVFSQDNKTEWLPPIGKYNYFNVMLNGKSVPVVSFYHPQMRGNHAIFEERYHDMEYIGKYLLAIGETS